MFINFRGFYIQLIRYWADMFDLFSWPMGAELTSRRVVRIFVPCDSSLSFAIFESSTTGISVVHCSESRQIFVLFFFELSGWIFVKIKMKGSRVEKNEKQIVFSYPEIKTKNFSCIQCKHQFSAKGMEFFVLNHIDWLFILFYIFNPFLQLFIE